MLHLKEVLESILIRDRFFKISFPASPINNPVSCEKISHIPRSVKHLKNPDKLMNVKVSGKDDLIDSRRWPEKNEKLR